MTMLMAKPADPNDEILTRNLKRFREEAGLSQEDAASAAGIPASGLTRYERGVNKIPVPALRALAEIYGHTMDDFFLLDPPPARLAERTTFLFRLMPGMDPDPDLQAKAIAFLEKINREQREIREKKGRKK